MNPFESVYFHYFRFDRIESYDKSESNDFIIRRYDISSHIFHSLCFMFGPETMMKISEMIYQIEFF